jgi:catechol 2,3-dioxygenase-like lactoylglutathione lyase family enzyme
MVINTRHIGFVVDDLERFIDFYQGLGLKLISRKLESGEYIERLVGLKNTKLEWAKLSLPDNSMIEIIKYHSNGQRLNNSNQLAHRLGCSHIALTVEKIEDAIIYFIENGGSVSDDFQISPDGKVKVVYCYDFEGNIIEIVEELK